jgi:hypothetical protein
MMNHVRQQAMGNLIISGLLGARMHLHRRNPVASWMKKLGLPISDLAQPALQPLTEADAEMQARILLAEYGRSTQRQRTRMLVDTALTPRI